MEELLIGVKATEANGVRRDSGNAVHHHQELYRASDPEEPAPIDGEEKEPDPNFLGSVDYHNFLHGAASVDTKLTPSSTKTTSISVATSMSSGDVDVNIRDFSAPETAFKVKPCKEVLQKELRGKASTETIKPTLKHKQSHPTLRERRSQALAEQFARTEAFRRVPKLQLPPTRSTIGTALQSSQHSPLETLASTPTVSSVSFRKLDSAKFKRFIGPLGPQAPPPTIPLPQPPSSSKPKLLTKNSIIDMMVKEKEKAKAKAEAKVDDKEDAEQAKTLSIRKKISKLFGDDTAPAPRAADTSNATDNATDNTTVTSYRPISLTTSHDSNGLSFSEIFDDVYNAARGSLISGRASRNSACVSHQSGRASRNSGRDSISAPSDFVDRLPSQFEETAATERAIPTALSLGISEPPPLIEHPAIRGDLALQAQLGLIPTASSSTSAPAPTPTFELPPLDLVPALNINRQRPAQIDAATPQITPQSLCAVSEAYAKSRLTREESAPTTTAGPTSSKEDIDPCPSFDRTVDLTLYRRTKMENGVLVSCIGRPSDKFTHVWTLFVGQFSKGREMKPNVLAKYESMKRFCYFDLPDKVRFNIIRHLIADTHSDKPILLNGKRQAYPAWPGDAFVTLWSVLGPLQGCIWADPWLRADIMVTIFLTRPIHVIFSPFVKGTVQPLPTKWFFKYVHMMQDVRVELDLTKLGFGPTWQATTFSTKLQEIGNLVHVFVEEMLTRHPKENSMGRLTLHCRRFFGYRQGENPYQGRKDLYGGTLIGADSEDPRHMARLPDGTVYNEGQPYNYNRKAASIPPSHNNPYSGHRRHHSYMPNRVPFVLESQMSVASAVRKLVGRVDMVRMVGFSEQWSHDTHSALWPRSEFEAIPNSQKPWYIERATPSRHSYVADGFAAYFDYGIRHGVHRFPPLADSEPMVCAHYDREQDLFVEIGSGKVLTVKENGIEFIARVLGPPLPVSKSPVPRGSPVTGGSPTFVVRPSRIPTPVGAAMTPTMEAMRVGSPHKVAQLLDLLQSRKHSNNTTASISTDAQRENTEDDEDPFTNTKTRSISNASAIADNQQLRVDVEQDQLGELDSLHSRSGSVRDSAKPGKLSTKRSFLGFVGGERKKE